MNSYETQNEVDIVIIERRMYMPYLILGLVALVVLSGFGWWWYITDGVSSLQQTSMLSTEHGSVSNLFTDYAAPSPGYLMKEFAQRAYVNNPRQVIYLPNQILTVEQMSQQIIAAESLRGVQKTFTPEQIMSFRQNVLNVPLFEFGSLASVLTNDTASLNRLVTQMNAELTAYVIFLQRNFNQALPYQLSDSYAPDFRSTELHASLPNTLVAQAELIALIMADVAVNDQRAVANPAILEAVALNEQAGGMAFAPDVEAARQVARQFYQAALTSDAYTSDLTAARLEWSDVVIP